MTRVKQFDWTGKPWATETARHRLRSAPFGRWTDDEAFFTSPRSSTPLHSYRSWSRPASRMSGSGPRFPSQRRYEVKQVWYPSKDGTKVPMFLVSARACAGRQPPVLLTGYGGFNLPSTPAFSPWPRGGPSTAACSRCPTCAAAANSAKLAPRRHVREEAERVRRFHRRGRMADPEPVHQAGAGSRSKADPTAAC